jgi:hypothetical protein
LKCLPSSGCSLGTPVTVLGKPVIDPHQSSASLLLQSLHEVWQGHAHPLFDIVGYLLIYGQDGDQVTSHPLQPADLQRCVVAAVVAEGVDSKPPEWRVIGKCGCAHGLLHFQ